MSGMPQAGDQAPDFNLPRDGGETVTLMDFAGKKLVLYFYPKDNTSGCTQESIEFNQLKEKFLKAGAQIAGVSPDDLKSHAKFKTDHHLNFPLLSDESKEMLQAYGVWKEKSMYGRKYMGVERTTFLIDADGVIERVWEKVKVPGHAQAVLDVILKDAGA